MMARAMLPTPARAADNASGEADVGIRSVGAEMGHSMRSARKGLVTTVLIALLATGCSTEASRSAQGADDVQAQASESAEVAEPGLSPRPAASDADEPGGSASPSASDSSDPAESASADESASTSASPTDSASPSDTASRTQTTSSSRASLGFISAIGFFLDIAGLAFDIFDVISGGNEGSGGQTQATDLTKVYERLDVIESSIERTRRENQARFSELQDELNRQGMDASMRQFIDIENNGDEAMRAWLVLHECRINRARGQATCPDLGGTERAISDSMLRARNRLLNIVDERWRDRDIPTLAGAYNSRGAGRGLVEAAWNVLRTKPNNAAGVPAGSQIRAGQRMPVVTPELSSSMNTILDYYGVLIARYSFLRQAAVLEKSPSQNGCEASEEESACQRRIIEQIAQEAQRWVYGSGAGSVNSAAAQYKMPEVPSGALAVAGVGESVTVPNGMTVSGDRARRLVFSDGSAQPPRPKTKYEIAPMEGMRIDSGRQGRDDFRNLLASLEKYVGVSEFVSAFPELFTRSADVVGYKANGRGKPYSVTSDEGPCVLLQMYRLTRQGFPELCEFPPLTADISPNWVSRDVREEGTDYPMFGW